MDEPVVFFSVKLSALRASAVSFSVFYPSFPVGDRKSNIFLDKSAPELRLRYDRFLRNYTLG
jgi:hypothetical protein